MRENFYVVLILLLFLVSCNSSNDPENFIQNEIQVKVYNTKTWNSVTDKMDTVVGASVSLIGDSASYTRVTGTTTNNKGIAIFSNVKEKVYYITALKDDLSNLINIRVADGNLVGNLIVGVYKSQEDINSSAVYPGAVIGGVKLSDVNHDGQISSDDAVQGIAVDYRVKYKDINSDGIIDEKDLPIRYAGYSTAFRREAGTVRHHPTASHRIPSCGNRAQGRRASTPACSPAPAFRRRGARCNEGMPKCSRR